MAKRTRLLVLMFAPIALLALAFLSIRLIAGDSALPDYPRAGGIPEPVEAVEPACQEAGGPEADRPEPVGGERAEQADPALARAPSGPEAPLLEVEVYYLENGHEQKAAGAKVVVSSDCMYEKPDQGSAEAAPRSGPDERWPWAPEREFFCDAEGRVILPLGAMAGPVGKSGAEFHIRGWTRDRRHASGPRPRGCTVALDRYRRIRRTAPSPATGPVQRIRLELSFNQSVTVFVHDGEGRGVAGIPVQLFNPFRGLGSSGAKKSPDPIPVLPRESTTPEGRCTFSFPLCKDFRRIKHICYAGFAFPLGDQSRWFRKVAVEHFAGGEVELEMPPRAR